MTLCRWERSSRSPRRTAAGTPSPWTVADQSVNLTRRVRAETHHCGPGKSCLTTSGCFDTTWPRPMTILTTIMTVLVRETLRSVRNSISVSQRDHSSQRRYPPIQAVNSWTSISPLWSTVQRVNSMVSGWRTWCSYADLTVNFLDQTPRSVIVDVHV